ncbi:MAG: HAD family acid phosphatase [Rhodanobacteraceae bacterium]
MFKHHLFVLLLAGTVLAGCASEPARQVTSTPAAPVAATTVASQPLAVAVDRPRNFSSDLVDATVWVQTAVEHDVIFVQTYRQAEMRLKTALADKQWDALVPAERENSFGKLPPAVILDIDETVLDNSPYEARMIRSGAEYNEATWGAWVKEASARPLPGALEFTRYAADHGVAVFYLSNRDQSLDEATLQNLRTQGFPVSGPDAFLGLGTIVPDCEQIGTQKTCRRQLVGRKYRVLMQFGDQIGDFMPVLVNTPDGRRKATAPHMDWFGERWFMLPNPMYGHWQPALFNNDWTLSPARRHAETVEALRVK